MTKYNYTVSAIKTLKKTFAVLLSLSLILGMTIAVFSAVDKTTRIYIDASAPAGGNGSVSSPYNSFASVLDNISYNLAFSNYTGDVEIIFAEGVYVFDSTVRITSALSGRNNIRFTYKAADGEKVVFSGGSGGKVLSGSLIELSGASYITFDGISFEDNLNAPLLSVKGNNVSVIGCTFSGTGSTVSLTSPEKGYALSLDGTGNTVDGCEIKGACGGIYMKGGSLTKLTDSGNAIRKSYIHDVTGCAVYVSGVGADIVNNTIAGSHSAVEFTGAMHTIKYNRITDTAESAVHTAGSPTYVGIDVGLNYIDGAGDAAVSLPMGTSFSSVHHNIIRNASVGVYLGGGRELDVTNNILIFDSVKNTAPHSIKYDMSLGEVLKNDSALYDSLKSSMTSAGYGTDAWIKHFPQMKNISVPEKYTETGDTSVFYNPANSVIENNAFYTAGDVRSAALTVTDNTTESYVYQKRHGVIHMNVMMPHGSLTDFPLADFCIYTLKSNAEVFSRITGFEDIPFEMMGHEGTDIELPFVDVKDTDWYYKWAYYTLTHGLMKGTDAAGTLFSGNVTTTRAMLVQILYNMEGAPKVEYSAKFTDVAEGAWYASAVIWAEGAGITSGTSDNTFSPDKALTREQLAVFLYRYLRDYKKITPSEGISPDTFTDAATISGYTDFKEAISWALGEGILTGKSTTSGLRLAPTDTAQRSEAAAMLARFCLMMGM